jgi:hypothetical protein
MRMRWHALGIASLLSVAVSASAQNAGSGATSGSGTTPQQPAAPTVEQRIDTLAKLLEKRDVKTRDDLAERQDRLDQFLTDKRAYEKELAISREKCTADIRRANRDTKLMAILSCYRADLTLQMAFLRKETTYMKQLTGISPEAKTKFTETNRALSDAMATIITAIDSDVYEAPEEVESAKKKLRDNYQHPRYLALGLIRADRALGWTGFLAQRIRQLWPMTAPESSERAILAQSVECLEKTAADLKAFGSQENYESTKEKFGQYQSGLTKCAESLRSAYRSAKGIPESSSGSLNTGAEAAVGTGTIIGE